MLLRKGSLRIKVNQDNLEKKLIINTLENAVDEINGGDYIGYTSEDLAGKPLEKILPTEINELIEDNIEYSLEGNDLKAIMEKVINLRVINKKNEEIDVNAHVDREISTPEEFLFSIIFERKIFLKDKIKEVLAKLAEKQQITHELTGVANGLAYIDALDELRVFLQDKNIDASLCLISVDGFPAVRMDEGKKKADEILGKIGAVMRSNFRNKDLVGYIGSGKFIVLMARTYEDEIVYPLKRLESSLRKEGILNSKISYNARYEKLDLKLSALKSLEKIKNKDIDFNFSTSSTK